MFAESSFGDLLFHQLPILLAALAALVFGAVRLSARSGPAILAIVAGVLLAAGALVRAIGISRLIEQIKTGETSPDSGMFDIIDWSSTILVALAFVLLGLAFLLGVTGQRRDAGQPPAWRPPPQPGQYYRPPGEFPQPASQFHQAPGRHPQ